MGPIGALLVMGWGALVLSGIATGVKRGTFERLDRSILMGFRTAGDLSDPVGPLWMEEALRDITALGSVTVAALVIVLLFVMDLIVGRRRTAVYHLCMLVVGLALTFYLKDVFSRPRPELVPHAARVLTNSFPSGHAATAMMTQATMGAFIAQGCVRTRSKVLAIGVALLLSISVGVSRIYLGVHWPTDILAGWVLGAAWAWAGWILESDLRSRGVLESARK